MAKRRQLVSRLCNLLFPMLAASTRRRDLFRAAFKERQLAELARIRRELQEIFSDVCYVASIQDTLLTTGWSQKEWRSRKPDAYEQYQRYKNTSLDLFYTLTDPDLSLLPRWFDRRKVEDFMKVMVHWAPFTIPATAKSHEEAKAYMDAILKLSDELDHAMKQNA